MKTPESVWESIGPEVTKEPLARPSNARDISMSPWAGENSHIALSVINSLCGNNGEIGYFNVPDMTSLMIPEKIMRDSGLGYIRALECFNPVICLAVKQASEQKELAGDFIKKLLCESIQDADLDGIPVNPTSLEKKPENRQENVAVGMHFVKTLPDGSKEERKQGEIGQKKPYEFRLYRNKQFLPSMSLRSVDCTLSL